jgi:Rieske Fe-S protein
LAAIGALASAVLTGVPAARAFLSPTRQRTQPKRWIKLGEVDQIETGVPTRFDFVETANDAWVETRVLRGVWIFTEDGERFTVYNGHCPHLACSYGFDKDHAMFICPCHRGVFDLKTGSVLDGPPPRPLDTLETKIEAGILYAAYSDFRAGVAEKIPLA